MVFLNDGSVGSVGSLLSGGQDSFGKPLRFKLNAETGTYEAQGSDRKIYYIDPMVASNARVSVAQMPSDAYVKAVREANDDQDMEVRAGSLVPSAPAATVDNVLQKNVGAGGRRIVVTGPEKPEDVKADIEKADQEYKSKRQADDKSTQKPQAASTTTTTKKY